MDNPKAPTQRKQEPEEMIKGIGTDILSLSRLRAVIARRGAGRVARRILSEAEMAEFRALGPAGVEKGIAETVSVEAQTMFLGTRWAVKEALYKAAYPEYALTWKQITLAKDLQKPVLKITYPPPTAADVQDPRTRNAPRMDETHERCHVSVSHDADLVVAYVVVEGLP